MESKEVIARIGKILKDNTAITEDEYITVMNIFCENTFDYDIQQLYNNFEKTKYDYYIPEKILMRCYKNKSYSKALSLLVEDMDSENKTYEWGILFHNKGIWLLNRDIKVSNTQFSSQRTVFKILFTNKTDSKYFKYFNHDICLGMTKIYIFLGMSLHIKIQNFHLLNQTAGMPISAVLKDLWIIIFQKRGIILRILINVIEI